MKTPAKHDYRKPIACLAAAALLIAGVARAEDHEDDEREQPSAEEILEFCKQHVPEAIPLLERVRTEEPLEDYQEVLEEAGDRIMEYREILDHEGAETAKHFLSEIRMELQIDEIIFRWFVAQEEGGDADAIAGELRTKLAEQMDLEIEVGLAELDALKAEVAEFEAELAEMKAAKEAEIDERMAEILEDHGDDEDGEEEEEDDDDDDDEDKDEDEEEDEDEDEDDEDEDE